MKRSLSKLVRGADSVETHRLPNEHNKAVGDAYATREVPSGLNVTFGLECVDERRKGRQKRY